MLDLDILVATARCQSKRNSNWTSATTGEIGAWQWLSFGLDKRKKRGEIGICLASKRDGDGSCFEVSKQQQASATGEMRDVGKGHGM